MQTVVLALLRKRINAIQLYKILLAGADVLSQIDDENCTSTTINTSAGSFTPFDVIWTLVNLYVDVMLNNRFIVSLVITLGILSNQLLLQFKFVKN